MQRGSALCIRIRFTYRYNKIREVLRLDHQRSMDDTWMLICLYLYLKL